METIIQFLIRKKYKLIVMVGFFILYFGYYHTAYPKVNPFTSFIVSLLFTILFLEGVWPKVITKVLLTSVLVLTSSRAFDNQQTFFVAVTAGIALSFLVVDLTYQVLKRSRTKKRN